MPKRHKLIMEIYIEEEQLKTFLIHYYQQSSTRATNKCSISAFERARLS